MMEFLSSYLEHFTILGLFFALMLAGLGIPLPEDLILITAGVLAYQGVIHLGWAIPILYIGVLSGNLLTYSFGRRFADIVLRHPLARSSLPPASQHPIEPDSTR